MKIKLTVTFILISICLISLIYFSFKYTSNNRQSEVSTISKNLAIPPQAQFYDYQGQLIKGSVWSQEIDWEEQVIRKDLMAPEAMIVHLWASWCEPCLNEIPMVIQYNQKHSKVPIVAINMDYSVEDIAQFMKAYPEFIKTSMRMVWDKNSHIAGFFQIEKLPATIIFFKDKKYVKIYGQADWQGDLPN